LLLALTIAVLAVLGGLGLGLAPAVSRRALGPLRTLALSSVLAVVALHLLPEALASLGVWALLAFATGLAAPRWLTLLGLGHRHHAERDHLGFSLGYWSLLVHHVGDGLALGAYSRADAGHDHAHTDVLLALVLHTVPFVAVVAAGYLRLYGARSAIVRCAGLGLASVVGVLGARLVPPPIVDSAQAWIAAGVSGLLLHGLSHDLARDLPTRTATRVVDCFMAVIGLAVGTLGATLDVHEGQGLQPELVLRLLTTALERLALPLAAGLLIGALVTASKWRSSLRWANSIEPGQGGVTTPEAYLTTLGTFGLWWALLRDGLSYVIRDIPEPQTAPTPIAEDPSPGFVRKLLARLDERVDALGAWALIGALMATVIRAALPIGALQGNLWLSLALTLVFCASVPLHAVAAIQVAAALFERGLSPSAAAFVAVLAPFAARTKSRNEWLRLGVVAVLLGFVVPHVPLEPLPTNTQVAWTAGALLVALMARRIYLLGFRGFLLALVRSEHAFLPPPAPRDKLTD